MAGFHVSGPIKNDSSSNFSSCVVISTFFQNSGKLIFAEERKKIKLADRHTLRIILGK